MLKRIHKIYCHEDKDGKKYRSYLGYLLLDKPGTAGFYCKNCKTHYEYTLTNTGIIEKSKISFKEKIEDFDSLITVEGNNGKRKS